MTVPQEASGGQRERGRNPAKVLLSLLTRGTVGAPSGCYKAANISATAGTRGEAGMPGERGKEMLGFAERGHLHHTEKSHMRIKKHKFITHGNVLNFRNQSFFDYLENAYLKMHLHF